MLRIWLIPWDGSDGTCPDGVVERLAGQPLEEVLSGHAGPAARLARSIARRHGLEETVLPADVSSVEKGPGDVALLAALEARARSGGGCRTVCAAAEPEECRRAVCRILGIPDDRRDAVRQDPGAVNLLVFDGARGWILETVNDTEHLRRRPGPRRPGESRGAQS
jgi:hypothetical protein